MSGDTAKGVSKDFATVAWDRLSECVDELISAWSAGGDPPKLANFAPAEPPALRHLVLVELVKVDLEHRWQQQRYAKTVEEYVAEFPELSSDGEVPCDLIYEEFHIRKMAGAAADPEQYFKRFPKQAEQLRRLLDLEAPQMTTTLVGAEKRAKELEVGTQIDDFDLLTKLGRGAFASVFLARQRSMQRLVALKVSNDKGSEPQTLAQLDHPYIVRVFDQRLVPDKKLRLMYMQHIPGGTLQGVVELARRLPSATRSGRTLLEVIDQALTRGGESPPAESSIRRKLSAASWPEAVCWLGARLASALEYAHQRGVLHRDVKPANVLLAADGAPKLADFNVSFSSKLDGATPAAYFGGSLAYMSPEQLEAAHPDHPREPDELDGRSDVYSLGVMLWELLTGTRPFGDETLDGRWADVLTRMIGRRRAGLGPSALGKLPADLPPNLDNLLMACLSPEAADRPTAGRLARELELCLQPRVQRLLRPSAHGVRQWLRKYPMPTFILAAILPNAIFSAFNLFYNSRQIVKRLSPEEQHIFWTIQVGTVNTVAYLIGVAGGIWLGWPVMRALVLMRRGERPPPEQLPALRRRTLILGHAVTAIVFLLWLSSGFAFPFWLSAQLGESTSLKMEHYLHFASSQFLCGLIAATQTYFLLTFISVRYYYPMFVVPDAPATEGEVAQLARVERRSGWYFGLAVSAPFLAVILLVVFLIVSGETAGAAAVSDLERQLQLELKIAMVVIAFFGVIGSLLAYRLLRAIQGDLATLAIAVDPAGTALGGTETAESLSATWR